MSWQFEFGRSKQPNQSEIEKELDSKDEHNQFKKWRATFFKQKKTPKPKWGFMKRIEHEPKTPSEKELSARLKKSLEDDFEEFGKWLDENYKNITIDLSKEGRLRKQTVHSYLKKKTGYSYLVSGVFLQFIATTLLGALTKFRLGNRSHAIWFLVWMYGGPMLRWSWLNDNSIDKVPCLSVSKWILFAVGRFLYLAVLLVGVFGGISVICVELLEDVCNKTLSLSTSIWFAVACTISTASLLLYFAITRFEKFACKSLKPALIEYFSFRCWLWRRWWWPR